MDRREYVCNQMYKQHDLLRKGSWTDADKLEYMELNIAPYSRYWRMGMKKALKHAIRLLREEEAKADRKTEPTISKMEQVDKDINVRSKDEPTTQMKTQNSNLTFEKDEPQTTDYCDVCNHKGCDNCIADGSNPYCVPSHYEPKDEPQTFDKPTKCLGCLYSDLDKAFHPCASCENFSKYIGEVSGKDEPQTERSE